MSLSSSLSGSASTMRLEKRKW